MTNFNITINTDNEAFQNGNYEYEIKRILKELIKKVDSDDYIKVYDLNGNPVGEMIQK